ncbi:hypothetical protein Val02_08340 [Virgisporangium aliadipatigenens]|uniref:Uncharacterized protein n=1 Tax=Virgisporangium aliadipatigenens TaxID=741659 RepID=A0A8J4DNU5_9ACTN|nr:hypothetical protein [Virgisporangium aliadipatigenens]GIJ43948.1 hypothetical protein Val02_08340 [Virgisporangium aliadipatigenens]
MRDVDRWTGALACALQAAAGMTNERFAGWLGIATRTVAYWHSRPDTVPGSANQDLLHAALRRLPAAARDRFVGEVRQPKSVADESVAHTVVAAVDDVTSDALLLNTAAPAESPESLQDEVTLLSRATSRTAFDVFTSARQIREEARRQVDRTRRPTALSDLYSTIGQATSLMASTAFDLGHWHESETLARASTRYADLAGHASLKAWTLGLQMTLANWRDEPDAALTYYSRAMSQAPEGSPRLRLRHIAARSYALLGDKVAVDRTLTDADRDRAVAALRQDELTTSVGGEFAFEEARAAACAAACWLDVHDGEKAVRYAETALERYAAEPPGRRPYSQINGALIDIAAGRLLMRDRDGVIAALGSVLDLPVAKRNVSLTGRMRRISTALAAPAKNGDSGLAQLAQRIESWLAETSSRPLI